MKSIEKVVWEHQDNGEAVILVESYPDKIHIDFKNNTVSINNPVTIPMAILEQIVGSYEDNSKVASQIMASPEAPF